VAGRDYNSKHTAWGSRISTNRGRELFHQLQENNYSFLTTGHPTYWPTDPSKQPDPLDFFVINEISSTFTGTEPSYGLSSDHSPVIATISTSPIYIQPIPKFDTHGSVHRRLLSRNTNKMQLCNRIYSKVF